eukprot:528902-Ditylum_brightwellii.AAC.1
MPISSKAYGKIAHKKTTKVEFAAIADIIQQCEPTNLDNKMPEKLLEEKEEQQHNKQTTGLTAQRKINAFIDA